MRRIIPIFALMAAAVWLYGTNLVRSLQPDELVLASQSTALARDGWHDSERRFLPVFVHVSGENWLAPLPVYLTALILKLQPSAVDPVRRAVVLVGSVDAALIYVLAYEMFRRQALALLAGVMLLLTPAHVMYSRNATFDGVWQLPLIIAWLIGLAAFVQRPFGSTRWMLAASAAALAFSTYAQPSAALMVPLFVMISIVALYRVGHLRWIDLSGTSSAFVAPLLPLILWFARYPSTYLDTFGRSLLHPAHLRNPVAWMQASTNWQTVGLCSQMYWDFFSPSHLFLNAQTPGFSGVFLLPVGVLIAIGASNILRGARTRDVTNDIRLIVLMGFLLAPLAAATFKEPRAIQRGLVVVPFGVLVATAGVELLWTRGKHVSRALAVLLLLAIPVQFYVDYRVVLGFSR